MLESRLLLEVLDGHLATHEYLAGDHSIADIASFALARLHEWPGLDIQGLDHLVRWMDAIAARPAVQRGLQIPPRPEDAEALVEKARSLLV